ncbi:zinc-binding alcohol dehydrogenase family protein [Spirosoma arcticum]
MKAAVTMKPGPPDVIDIQEKPKPSAKPGWVVIRVRAFGLNRSELYTRQGHSPGITFPIIQGIECVGEVADDPSGRYPAGQKVAACMGGMGRQFDGGYAEFVTVPAEIIVPFESELPWATLGAIPEMFQTVSGSLNSALEVRKGETLLIRGGTSSIGMLATQLAKHYGLTVIATTRNPDKETYLRENGADYVFIDQGRLAPELKRLFPNGVDKVLELVGTETLKDSLQCIRPKGIVCMTGILGNSWTIDAFTPMGDIPSLGRLTVYMGEASDLTNALLQDFIDSVTAGTIKLSIDRIFRLDQVSEAHWYMENNQGKGKIVVEV